MFRDLGNRPGQAEALNHLQDGDTEEAAQCLEQALGIYQRIGAHAARRVRQTLDDHGLTAAGPAPTPASEDHPSRPPAAPSANQ
jgi:hypothetical protein